MMAFLTLSVKFFIIFCYCHIKILRGLHAAALEQGFSVIDLLKDVQRFHGFEQILMMSNQNAMFAKEFTCGAAADVDDCDDVTNATEDDIGAGPLLRLIMMHLQVPVLQFNEKLSLSLKNWFSDNMLTLVYIDGALDQYKQLLGNLPLNLRHINTSLVMFLLKLPANQEEKGAFLDSLFCQCWSMRIINVIALFADFKESATYYSYTPFPEFELEAHRIHSDVLRRGPMFTYRLGNLRGYKLPYILGGSEPRIIVYTKPNGELMTDGFVGHYMRAFAKKYNLQLVQPLSPKLGEFAPAQDLVQAVRNGTVEISVALTFPTIPIIGFSYPYEQVDWCLMMPMEPDVPNYKFFVIVFDNSVLITTILIMVIISILLSAALYRAGYKPDLLDIVLNDDCFRGMLGQPFSEVPNAPMLVRFIYMEICVLGIILTTSYNSYFSTYVTSSPKQAPFQTFDDILASGIKISVFAPEYQELVGRVVEFKKYDPMFFKETNYQTYLRLRDSYNIKFGYMIPTTKMIIYNEQQKFFTQPLLRPRTDLCFFKNIPMCFPIHENSVYKQILYQLMLETAQAGLVEFWRQNAFMEMIGANKLQLVDLSKKREFEAMRVEDLQYIIIGLGIMLILVILIFMMEHCVHRRTGKHVNILANVEKKQRIITNQ